MEALDHPSGTALPPPLRQGSANQAGATRDLLQSGMAEDPAYDRETWALLEQEPHGDPLSLAGDDDH